MLVTYLVMSISGLLGSVIAWDELKRASSSAEQS